ncbi:uncharacterized protein [Littorina saxatilis]|uniref:Novel STAND NTPase 3 domain-containing protein n=1 Tax=Littorina saxatilis TaxID=31220 RepID=A0AAN9B608_9CAEN
MEDAEDKDDGQTEKQCPPVIKAASTTTTTASTSETSAATSAKDNTVPEATADQTLSGGSHTEDTAAAEKRSIKNDVTSETPKQKHDDVKPKPEGAHDASAAKGDAQATDTAPQTPKEDPSKRPKAKAKEEDEVITVSTEDLKAAAQTLQKYGRVILCGPPGTGKTSLAYALLNVFGQQGYVAKMSTIMCGACHMGLTEGGGPKRICLVDGMMGETRAHRETYYDCRSFLFNTQRVVSRTEFNALLVVTVLPHILKDVEVLDMGTHAPLADPRVVMRLTRNPVQPELPFVPRVENFVPLLNRMLRDTAMGNTLSALLGLTMQGEGFFLHHPPPIQKKLEEMGYRDVSCYGLAEYEDLLRGFIFADQGKGFASRTVYEGAGLALGRAYAINMLLRSCDAEFLTKYVRNDPDAKDTLTSVVIPMHGGYRRELMTQRLYEELTQGKVMEICQHPSLAYLVVLQELQEHCSAQKNFTQRLMSAVDAENGLPLLYWSVWNPSPHLNHWCLTELNRQVKREKVLTQHVLASLLASVLFAESGDSSLVEAAEIVKQVSRLKFKPDAELLRLTFPVPTVRKEDAGERLEQVKTRLKTSLRYLEDPAYPVPSSLLSVDVSDEGIRVELPSHAWYLVLRLLTDREGEEADEKGNTILHVAADVGDLGVIRLVLNTRASVTARNTKGFTPPQLAALRKPSSGKGGEAAALPSPADLHAACKKGDVEQVKVILCQGVSVDGKDDKGNSPLHTAIREGHAELVSLLAQLDADMNAPNEEGATPLHEASASGKQDLARMLLENGARVNATDVQGFTPLHAACSQGHTGIAALLIEKQAEINAKNKEGKSPLLSACQNGHAETAQLLLKLQADVNAANKSGNTALHKACEMGNADIVGILLQHNADVTVKNDDNLTALHAACKGGNVDIVSLLIEHNADIHHVNPLGETVLHIACKESSFNIVNLLLQNSAGVNAVSTSGDTALHKACERGNTELVGLLLQQHVEVNTKNQAGDTALHKACNEGNAEIVRLLLDKGAQVNAMNEKGDTALHTACEWSDLSYLLETVCQVSQEASEQRKAEIVSVLLQHNADVSVKNSRGKSPADMVRDMEHKGPVFADLLSRAG